MEKKSLQVELISKEECYDVTETSEIIDKKGTMIRRRSMDDNDLRKPMISPRGKDVEEGINNDLKKTNIDSRTRETIGSEEAGRIPASSSSAVPTKELDYRKSDSRSSRKVSIELKNPDDEKDQGSKECSSDTDEGIASDVEAPRPETRRLRRVGSLEDLTDRLIHAGVFEEYCRWRDNYARWRMGHATGARGEITQFTQVAEPSTTFPVRNAQTESSTDHLENVRRSDSHINEPIPYFQAYFPNFKSFLFKRTLAYWVSVFFLEGALLFTVAGVFTCMESYDKGRFPATVTGLPNVVGSIFFSLGAYLGYVQQMNIEKVPSQRIWFAWPWDLPFSCGITGWQAYFYGTLWFGIGVVAGMFEITNHTLQAILIWIPLAIGGALFIAGGVCEVLENFEDSGFSLVVVTSWTNFIGSFLFFFGSVVPFWDLRNQAVILYCSSWPYLIGSCCFAIAGVFSLFLWKKDMFGLTLSRRLNTLSLDQNRPLSTNTIAVNMIYIVSTVLIMVNFCMIHSTPNNGGTLYAGYSMLNSFILIMLVHFFLALTSVITILPKKQPFRGLMLAVRFLSFLLFADASVLFVCNLKEWNDSRHPFNPMDVSAIQ